MTRPSDSLLGSRHTLAEHGNRRGWCPERTRGTLLPERPSHVRQPAGGHRYRVSIAFGCLAVVVTDRELDGGRSAVANWSFRALSSMAWNSRRRGEHALCCLATDYDGTAGEGRHGRRRHAGGVVAAEGSGRRSITVSGRRAGGPPEASSLKLDPLMWRCWRTALAAPAARLVDDRRSPNARLRPPEAMRKRDLPFVAGEVIVATWEQQAKTVS